MKKLNKMLAVSTALVFAISTQVFAEASLQVELPKTPELPNLPELPNKKEGPKITDPKLHLKDQIMCPAVYKPVCAKVDTKKRCITKPCPVYVEKTFGNSCEAGRVKAEIIHEGACEGDDITLISDEISDEILKTSRKVDDALNKAGKVIEKESVYFRKQLLEALKNAKSEQDRMRIYAEVTGKDIQKKLDEAKKELEGKEKELMEKLDEVTEKIDKKAEELEGKVEEVEEKIKEKEKTLGEKAKELKEKEIKAKEALLKKSEYIFTNLDEVVNDVKKVQEHLTATVKDENLEASKEIKDLILKDLEKVEKSIADAEKKKNEAWIDMFELLEKEKEDLKSDLKIVQNKLKETKIYIKEAFLNLKSASANLKSLLSNK
ncbi:hypothetical protein CSB11_03090 [Candidatus Campbellbacteria bacterium]|nr:MAG: hypothetical protein CSB11_03090 [Candidatus Campbellbacteria bacterium]